MQRALLAWWKDNCHHFSVPEILLLSIPNGGHRTAVTAAIMKMEGARRGAPDLMLAVPLRSFDVSKGPLAHQCYTEIHGLFLELKTDKGFISQPQSEFHTELRNQGYRVEIIRSLQQGIDVITSYLK